MKKKIKRRKFLRNKKYTITYPTKTRLNPKSIKKK